MLDRIRLWGRLVGNVLPFIVKTCIIITGYCAIASAVYAQNSNPALEAARQHEQRLQQEQLRLQEEQQFRQPTVDIFLHPDGVEESNEKALASGRCFDIHTVQLEGVTRYNESVQQSWISPFIDQCLDLSRINELLKLVTHRYIEDGFVTSRAFLQPQNLSEGELTILVLEGRLESIESVEGSLSSRQLYLAFPTRDGHLLNLRDLEQGLEQLNRLQQNRAEMDIKPGSEQGYSTIAVRNQSAGRLHGGVGFNNSGSEHTGEWTLSSWLSVDNPSRSNDNLYLSFNEALGGPQHAKSRSYALSYNIPLGYWLIGYNTNYFEYQQLVKGASVDFVTRGTSYNQTLNADYVMWRRQRDKLAITGSVTRKESRNYLEDVFLETSSRVLYVIDLGAVHTRSLARGTFRSAFRWYRSVDWFDATTKVASAETDFQFDKYSIDLTFNTAIEAFGRPLFYTSSLHLFYSPDEVVASEALSIGGRYTVRGIEGEGLFGYGGGYWRNEVTYSHFFENSGRLDWFIGLDAGATSNPGAFAKKNDWIAGATTGLRYMNGNFSMDAAWSQAIHAPDYLFGDRHAVYAAAQLSF